MNNTYNYTIIIIPMSSIFRPKAVNGVVFIYRKNPHPQLLDQYWTIDTLVWATQ